MLGTPFTSDSTLTLKALRGGVRCLVGALYLLLYDDSV